MRYALALFALGIALELAAPAQADDKRSGAEVNAWSDVPPALQGYAAARDARHIDDLVPALTERRRPQETLRGVVTGIDERDDRLTVRLASNTTGDFKVQDALVFDVVYTGDAVEVTVENIAGAKTIVGLTIE